MASISVNERRPTELVIQMSALRPIATRGLVLRRDLEETVGVNLKGADKLRVVGNCKSFGGGNPHLLERPSKGTFCCNSRAVSTSTAAIRRSARFPVAVQKLFQLT